MTDQIQLFLKLTDEKRKDLLKKLKSSLAESYDRVLYEINPEDEKVCDLYKDQQISVLFDKLVDTINQCEEFILFHGRMQEHLYDLEKDIEKKNMDEEYEDDCIIRKRTKDESIHNQHF